MTIEEHVRLIKPKLWDFLGSLVYGQGPKNGWFTCRIAQVYFRISHHVVGGELTRTLDLANITVNKGFRGRGVFRAIEGLVCEYVEKHPDAPRVLYIENVIAPELGQSIARMGYTRLQGEDPQWPVACYYKATQLIAQDA